jgi:primosomal protein N' (replication factor Y) (superfamily II helicase)
MLIDVIVLRNAQPIDRTFTYDVPDNFISRIYPGARVLVPFGSAGLIDAVVIHAPSINTIDEDILIKKVHYAFDDGLFLTQKDLDTADYIRRETLCTYSEAISLFLPAGTAVKQIKNYALNADRTLDAALKKNECMVIEWLKKGTCTHDALCPDLKESAKTLAINRLLAMGYIELTYDYEQNVKDRTVEWIVADGDLVSHLKQIPEHHHAKIKLLKHLIEEPIVKRLALQETLKISKSVVDGFVQSGVISIVEKDDIRMPLFMKANESKRDVILNTAQQEIYNAIIDDYQNQLENDFLIHGVTGSGKTEVYAELIETVIKWGKKVILVVPEISLTPQIVARFASRFGESRIALIHSKISQGERYDQWKGIRSGKYDIIIGARSAVFAPSDDVGLIIIDECHESAFRSEKRPKYHTYDVAKYRMSLVGGFVVSGSATPSIVDYHSALQGKRKLLVLEQRHNTLLVPEIQVVDMREELVQGNKSILSRQLHEAITKRLENKEQTIIFLNRKGHSTFVSCRSCGFTLACPNCDVTLTYFKGEKSVKCNYCSYETFVPKLCPKCNSKYFKFFGVGTEKVEEELKILFPSANIARMDRTTTSKKGSIERIISDVEAEETDILIGTQMVAKGFDFKNVSLIGILSADLLLNLPQFQASERAYQLFNQVAGRAGRGSKSGEVILQTYIPDHYAINQSSYEAFYNHEIRYREALRYPPFYHMVNLIFTAKTSDEAGRYAQKSYLYLTSKLLKKGLQNELEIFHANPALLKKIDNVYRWQVIIKAKPSAYEALKLSLKTLEEKFLEVKTCKISIDLDASNIL